MPGAISKSWGRKNELWETWCECVYMLAARGRVKWFSTLGLKVKAAALSFFLEKRSAWGCSVILRIKVVQEMLDEGNLGDIGDYSLPEEEMGVLELP